MVIIPKGATPETEIARLTALNEEAADRIKVYMAEGANFKQVINARRGMILRDERIEDLRAIAA